MTRIGPKPYLDSLVATHDQRFLSTDPLAFLHRYSAPEDQEPAGLVASSLACGNVRAIQRSVEDALRRLGILDACPRHREAVKCARCPRQPVCRL